MIQNHYYCNDNRPILVGGPIRGTLTDHSGVITTGGISQVVAVANPKRSFLLIQNPRNHTESLWVSFVTNANIGSPSQEVPPGSELRYESNFIPVSPVSIIAVTTNHEFTCLEG